MGLRNRRVSFGRNTRWQRPLPLLIHDVAPQKEWEGMKVWLKVDLTLRMNISFNRTVKRNSRIVFFIGESGIKVFSNVLIMSYDQQVDLNSFALVIYSVTTYLTDVAVIQIDAGDQNSEMVFHALACRYRKIQTNRRLTVLFSFPVVIANIENKEKK